MEGCKYIVVLSSIVLLGTAPSTGTPLTREAEIRKFRCDYTYHPGGEGWFKLHPENLRSVASQTCKAEGAELASPLSENVGAVMMLMMYEDGSIPAVHTELEIEPIVKNTDLAIEKEGVTLTCGGKLKVACQNDYYPFICYKKAEKSMKTNECGTIDNDYQLDNRTNHCYKLHRNQASWSQALKTCAAEESSLAVINSEEEALLVAELLETYPPEAMDADAWKDTAFLGFRRGQYFAHDWETVDGLPLEQTGYEDFSPGEPNNAAGDEFCGAIGRDGMLFDEPCTRPLLFICEKETDSSCSLYSQLQNRLDDYYDSLRNRKYEYDVESVEYTTKQINSMEQSNSKEDRDSFEQNYIERTFSFEQNTSN